MWSLFKRTTLIISSPLGPDKVRVLFYRPLVLVLFVASPTCLSLVVGPINFFFVMAGKGGRESASIIT